MILVSFPTLRLVFLIERPNKTGRSLLLDKQLWIISEPLIIETLHCISLYAVQQLVDIGRTIVVDLCNYQIYILFFTT